MFQDKQHQEQSPVRWHLLILLTPYGRRNAAAADADSNLVNLSNCKNITALALSLPRLNLTLNWINAI